MKTNNLGRHGDLNFRATNKVEGKKLDIKSNSFVLAFGEHTGHKHVLTMPDLEDYEMYRTLDGGYILNLKKEGTITHEEHKPITLEAGIYKMTQEREFDYALSEVRAVQD